MHSIFTTRIFSCDRKPICA